MEKQIIEEFKKYAKKAFSYDIHVNKTKKPDSFASLFGRSFRKEKDNG